MTRKRRTLSGEQRTPLPVRPVNLLAGIAPGVDLGADDLPVGVAAVGVTMRATVSVEEVGKMLRCGDTTVRRLIQSGALRPIEQRGEVRLRRRDVLALRAGVLPSTPDKPGE